MRHRRSLSASSWPDGRAAGVAGRARLIKEREKQVLDNYQRVEAVLAGFAQGEIVVVTDDDDRENEGDLFVAASLCTPEKMAFIICKQSGIVGAPLAPAEA